MIGPRLNPRMTESANSHVIPTAPRRNGATNDCANSIPIETKPSTRAVP